MIFEAHPPHAQAAQVEDQSDKDHKCAKQQKEL